MPLTLAGCRNDSLLGYLKALGILRVLGRQATGRTRGAWDDATFALDAASRADLETFFLDRYSPTPILNPWNSGAGFDGNADTASATLQRIAATKGMRWEAYRNALTFIEGRYIRSGRRAQYLDAGDKRGFIRDLRATCPDAMLTWLDACILLTSDDLKFPYLFGSGGNDGRLDFSANFAARALDACGDVPTRETRQLLEDALFGTSVAQLLSDAAIGQFSPRHTGGANATSGFSAASLVNPWDYVLMIEGAVLFSGSIGRRTGTSRGRAVFPFALGESQGGYSSAGEEPTRGELWLPVWDGFASLPSIVDLLRKGRIDLPAQGQRSIIRAAAVAAEAAAAVTTLGIAAGLRSFERVAFVQRNGLAYSAAAVGRIRVDAGYDQGIAVLSRDFSAWVERARRAQTGQAFRDALRRFDDAILTYPNVRPEARPRARQDILIAIADLDRAAARIRSANALAPAPTLDGDVVNSLDDGTAVHRAALAVASLGARGYNTPVREAMRRAGDDAVQTLRDLVERRILEDDKDPNAGWLDATCTVSTGDAAEFLLLDSVARSRFNALLRAYGLIRLRSVACSPQHEDGDELIPAAYALLKIVFDNRRARDERIIRRLFSGQSASALQLAVRRARSLPNLPYPPRDVSRVTITDPVWTAAAIVLPLAKSDPTYGRLLRAALQHGGDDRDARANYLHSINGNTERQVR
ncbi:MAG TPA: type I-U CRISPR-associated protein Csx17 [Candidatus Acidoferrales bacterium]|nr:type I-U CRISPR-associated protein Csx17 [Candidatus Acidoferrales bacterium]